jgi:hypothetical protein
VIIEVTHATMMTLFNYGIRAKKGEANTGIFNPVPHPGLRIEASILFDSLQYLAFIYVNSAL